MLYNALGDGGFASLRVDTQGKGFAQLLLSEWVQVPQEDTITKTPQQNTSQSGKQYERL